MRIIYRLKANELDNHFIDDLQRTYKDREIEIIVSEVDETKYLLQSKINKARLLKAINNIERGVNLIDVKTHDL